LDGGISNDFTYWHTVSFVVLLHPNSNRKWRFIVKVLCKDQHWSVKENQLVLDTPEGQEILKKVIKTLEAQIRLDIYEQICALPLLQDRKRLVKMGIEYVALQVQDLCAQIALGEKK